MTSVLFIGSCDVCTSCLLSLEVELHEEQIWEVNHRQVFQKASVAWVPLLPNNYIIIFHVHVSNMMNP